MNFNVANQPLKQVKNKSEITHVRMFKLFPATFMRAITQIIKNALVFKIPPSKTNLIN
jgi:hypothetical protein